MFDILILILFGWLLVGTVRLTFRVTWGLAKIAAVALCVLALPILLGCLLLAGGALLLVPLALAGAAFGILKACL
jgi:hypothetical protein